MKKWPNTALLNITFLEGNIMTIGQRIFASMKENEISVADLSSKTGISQNEIVTWYGKSTPKVMELFIVSHALNTTMEYLISGDQCFIKLAPELKRKFSILNKRAIEKVESYIDGLLSDDDNIDKNKATAEAVAFWKEAV
jgi:hypothetical protein